MNAIRVMEKNVFVPSSIDGYLGSSHSLAVVDNAAVNTAMYKVCTFF